MPYQVKDEQAWDEFKRGVLNEKNCFIRDTPKRLSVIRKMPQELPLMLDLHGLTVQQAFDTTVRFLTVHYRAGTKEVVVVTGKGTMGEGLIKKEFDAWMKNQKIQKYIRTVMWQNRGGAVKITLKRK